MIGPLRGVSAHAYGEPCDMRKSFDTLSAMVANQLKRDLMSADLFIFVGKDRKRAKVLYFDGTGNSHERIGSVVHGVRWKSAALVGPIRRIRRS